MSDTTAAQKALEAILVSDKIFLTPAEVAPILGVAAHYIRVAARQHPDDLKFPFEVYGTRTKIPRIPFLKYLGVNVDRQQTQEIIEKPSAISEEQNQSTDELLLLIIRQINELRQEMGERLNTLEKQTPYFYNVLQSQKIYIKDMTKTVNKR